MDSSEITVQPAPEPIREVTVTTERQVRDENITGHRKYGLFVALKEERYLFFVFLN